MGLRENPTITEQLTAENYTLEVGKQIASIFIRALPDIDDEHDTEQTRTSWAEGFAADIRNPDKFINATFDEEEEGKVLGALCGNVATAIDNPEKIPAELLIDGDQPIAPEQVFYVDTLAVDPNEQGGGIGAKLMEDVYNYVREHPTYRYVFLRTDSEINDGEHNRAVDFYEKQGFKNLGESQQGRTGKVHFIKKIENIPRAANEMAERVTEIID